MNCPSEGEREVASVYLKGALPEAEARAFEEHYFQCQRCAEAVAVGSRVRSAFGKAPVVNVPAAVPAPRTWLPFAAAAAVALLAVGLWQVAHKGPDLTSQPVLRGGASAPLAVGIEAGPRGDLILTWTPLPAAARYVVRVTSADGRSVWSSETREPRLTVDAAALDAAKPGTPLEVQVEALDAMERVVATSEPAKVPGR